MALEYYLVHHQGEALGALHHVRAPSRDDIIWPFLWEARLHVPVATAPPRLAVLLFPLPRPP